MNCALAAADPGMAGFGPGSYPCTEPGIGRVTIACRHEHIDTPAVCIGCAVDLQMLAGALTCWRCYDHEQDSHECPVAVTITWDDGTVTRVQDTEGRAS